MSTSQITPASVLRNYSPEQLGELIKHLTPEERAEAEAILLLNEDRAEQDDILSRCAEKVVAPDRGPMYWLRNWTKTEDFQWQSRGIPATEAKAPFPFKPHPGYDIDYMDVVMRYLLTERELYIPKTREMMTSWLVVGYITWMCQFFVSTGWIGQSESLEKAKGLIKYSNTLYSNQPDWMRLRFPLAGHAGKEEGTLTKVEWAHGSWFTGVPQGERQLASKHPYGYFNDESAHQPGWEAAKDIAAPAVRQSLHVSSAAFSRFGDLTDESLAI
jgi:hypothetical protein